MRLIVYRHVSQLITVTILTVDQTIRDTIVETKLKQHMLLPTLVFTCICVQVETCENFSLIRYKRVKMYDLLYLGASKLLRYKRDFVICNFAVSVKFKKRNIDGCLGFPNAS